MYSLIQQTFTEDLLCAGYSGRFWGYSSRPHTVFAFLEEKGLEGNTPKPNPQRYVPLGGIKDDFNVFLNISLYFL